MERERERRRPLGLVIKAGTLCLVLWPPSPLVRCEGGGGWCPGLDPEEWIEVAAAVFLESFLLFPSFLKLR